MDWLLWAVGKCAAALQPAKANSGLITYCVLGVSGDVQGLDHALFAPALAMTRKAATIAPQGQGSRR